MAAKKYVGLSTAKAAADLSAIGDATYAARTQNVSAG